MLPLDRLKKKIGIANLWIYILYFLSKKPRYAYELRALVHKKFGFRPGQVTSYRVLYSLEISGMVKTIEKEKRVYYRITVLGKKEFANGKAFLKSVSKRLA